jgi:hypothetical protein
MNKKFNIKEWQEKNLITEANETLIWEELGDKLEDLFIVFDKIVRKTDDPKWEKALKVVHDQLRKVEGTIDKYDKKLGAIPLNR